MELTNVPMFGIIRQRMTYLNQRQEVLAQNIANADTPEYRAQDLKAFKVDGRSPGTANAFRVNMSVTDPQHIAGQRSGSGDFKQTDVRRPYETSPDGNAVVLEEQMVKMNENGIDHRLVTELYRKHLRMFQTVTRRGGA